MIKLFALITVICFSGIVTTSLFAQEDTTPPECVATNMAQQQLAFQDIMSLDFEADYDTAITNLFRLGAIYQDLAVRCGYTPSEAEVDVMIQLVIQLADIETILAANSVGTDVQAILIELDEVNGDPSNGLLLYNGEEPGIDGFALGCSGCHTAGQTAPMTEGTWTRFDEELSQLPELEGYTFEQYIVESIVDPNAHISPGFGPDLMPQNYGGRLELQKLADLIAFLESQDQLLDDD